MIAGASDSTTLSAYGPILIATAGLITALVAALGRRDKKTADITGNLDARTKTALAGIQAYADRAEAERARWQEFAEKETARADAAEQKVEELEKGGGSSPGQPPQARHRRGKSQPDVSP